ncbi:MAG: hypothetical protein A2512_05405 [Deltaproteobacteria bacterium RIFOXYD12_FULL_56_24]|nr:MAG: hypothetical protein A2512_05405 [Deltaproteobacteria bacterium RIFOXYD12_FULL_56_24]
MRLVTINTDRIRIVFLWINTGQFGTQGIRIVKPGVTAKTELARAVYYQLGRIFRVIACRAVAVLALDYAMFEQLVFLKILFVAILAVLATVIFDFDRFPVVKVCLTVETEGIVLSVNPEIFRDVNLSGN